MSQVPMSSFVPLGDISGNIQRPRAPPINQQHLLIEPHPQPLTTHQNAQSKPRNRVIAMQKTEKPTAKIGRKSKSIEKRKEEWKEPVHIAKKVKIFRPKEAKVPVIMYYHCTRVEYWDFESKSIQFRPPFHREIADKFPTIPVATIGRWLREQEKILSSKKGSRMVKNYWLPYWPEMEIKLFELFKGRRLENKLIGHTWILNNATKIYKQLYPEYPLSFTFSRGWLQGWLRRYGLAWRSITRQATKLPADYERYILNFLRYMRRICLIKDSDGSQIRFPPEMVVNMDETPIPFEYLDGRTYTFKGEKTVNGKTDRNSWTKRQATLILYIFANGQGRMKPVIVFHGSPSEKGGKIEDGEKTLYNPGVIVKFNKTAYNNEELMLESIDTQFKLATGVSPTNPLLLVMDCAAFHKTELLRSKLKEASIEIAMIPPGLTGLLQPLDTHINKVMKQFMKEETEIYVDNREDEMGIVEKWSVSQKRVMCTHVVARAWERLCNDKSQVVIKSFKDTGIYMPSNKSEDAKIRIKGFEGFDVGDITFRDIAIEGYEYRPIKIEEEESVLTLAGEVAIPDDFDGLSNKQLINACKARGIKGYSNLKKAELKTRLIGWQEAWNLAHAEEIAQLHQDQE